MLGLAFKRAVLVAAGCGLFPGAGSAQPVTNEEILQHFAYMAFDAQGPADPPPTIAKWDRPIRIFVRSDAEPKVHRELKSMVEAQAEQLSFITGLDMEVLDHGLYNFLVIFAADIYADAAGKYRDIARAFFPDEREMARLLAANRNNRTYCVVYQVKDEAKRRSGALVLIPYSPDARPTLGCVAERMTQALGFVRDGRDMRVSLFGEGARKQRYFALTSQDIVLLGMLYDPKIKHGMTRSEAMPIARDILQALRPLREPPAQPPSPLRRPSDRVRLDPA